MAFVAMMLGWSVSTLTAAQSVPVRQQNAESTKQSVADTPAAAIPDVKVLDQNGKALHFYSDLVRGKVVVINFVFTTCTTICPPLGATFGKLQKNLGERLGKDVFLISISVDPATDTPERLRAWGAQFGAKPGWTLVTGDKSELNHLLRAFGADAASPENHSPMVLIVNDRALRWKRVYGLGSTSALTRAIEEMTNVSSVDASERHQ
jgi:protein SCO1/2